jgi:hypothetical protein
MGTWGLILKVLYKGQLSLFLEALGDSNLKKIIENRDNLIAMLKTLECDEDKECLLEHLGSEHLVKIIKNLDGFVKLLKAVDCDKDEKLLLEHLPAEHFRILIQEPCILKNKLFKYDYRKDTIDALRILMKKPEYLVEVLKTVSFKDKPKFYRTIILSEFGGECLEKIIINPDDLVKMVKVLDSKNQKRLILILDDKKHLKIIITNPDDLVSVLKPLAPESQKLVLNAFNAEQLKEKFQNDDDLIKVLKVLNSKDYISRLLNLTNKHIKKPIIQDEKRLQNMLANFSTAPITQETLMPLKNITQVLQEQKALQKIHLAYREGEAIDLNTFLSNLAVRLYDKGGIAANLKRFIEIVPNTSTIRNYTKKAIIQDREISINNIEQLIMKYFFRCFEKLLGVLENNYNKKSASFFTQSAPHDFNEKSNEILLQELNELTGKISVEKDSVVNDHNKNGALAKKCIDFFGYPLTQIRLARKIDELMNTFNANINNNFNSESPKPTKYVK